MGNFNMMEFTFFLITLISSQYLDICNSTTCGWTNNNFVIDSDFDDVFVDKGVLESFTKVHTIIVCQKMCLNNSQCVSFFFNRLTGMCKPLGVKLFNEYVGSTQHINDTGSRYFNLQDPGKQCTDYIWDRMDNKCYKIVPSPVNSYDIAKQTCANNGDNLLVTETTSFLERVKRQIKSNSVFNTAGYFFGATDAVNEGVWRWINGKVVSINNWKSGFPKNQTVTSDYMLMVKAPVNDWRWIDTLKDIQPRRYICERYISDIV